MKILKNWDYTKLNSETIKIKTNLIGYINLDYVIMIDNYIEFDSDVLIQQILNENFGG